MIYFGKKKESGFTFIELVIYLAMVSLITATIALLAFSITEARVRQQTVDEVINQGFWIQDTITKAIQDSESVTFPSFDTGSAILELVMSDANVDPTIFSLSAGVLQLQEDGGVLIDLHNDFVAVSNLYFDNRSVTSSGREIITFSFTVTRDSPNTSRPYSYEQDFTKTVAVRNYD